jgi:plasmid stabilization system protein ParE
VPNYTLRPAVDIDLISSANHIGEADSSAARRFLDTSFAAFDLLARFPEVGPKARFKNKRLKDVRFWVLSPPFNKWLVFYRRTKPEGVEIIRVLHGMTDWRRRPTQFLG